MVPFLVITPSDLVTCPTIWASHGIEVVISATIISTCTFMLDSLVREHLAGMHDSGP